MNNPFILEDVKDSNLFITNGHIEDSIKKMFEDIEYKDKITVGICGDRLTGKSSLINYIAERAKEKNIFPIVNIIGANITKEDFLKNITYSFTEEYQSIDGNRIKECFKRTVGEKTVLDIFFNKFQLFELFLALSFYSSGLLYYITMKYGIVELPVSLNTVILFLIIIPIILFIRLLFKNKNYQGIILLCNTWPPHYREKNSLEEKLMDEYFLSPLEIVCIQSFENIIKKRKKNKLKNIKGCILCVECGKIGSIFNNYFKEQKVDFDLEIKAEREINIREMVEKIVLNRKDIKFSDGAYNKLEQIDSLPNLEKYIKTCKNAYELAYDRIEYTVKEKNGSQQRNKMTKNFVKLQKFMWLFGHDGDPATRPQPIIEITEKDISYSYSISKSKKTIQDMLLCM